MVEWSIAAFRAAAPVRSIVVACPPGHVHELGGHDLGVVEGGKTRAESVANALAAVGTELVAIHDAARPLATPALIEAVIATLAGDPDAGLAADPEAAGAIAATPVTDTIKRAAPRLQPLGGYSPPKAAIEVEESVDRGRLWAAQTPQVFRTEALREALAAWPGSAAGSGEREATDESIPVEATDESMLVEAAGGKVLIHPSPPENLKVTTPLDLRLAELLLESRP
jgi:2-C-methyl-D-erythritol 4-phosphate cytidylyltransferase